jgi:hypothetical protein
MEPEFGIFEPVFESAHGYLALLHLTDDDAPKAVDLVRECCHRIANPYPEICRLLSEPNWRPHLVAAIALIVSGHDSEATRCMWHRFDTGSWVTPQIGVALYLVDRDFEAQSRLRLEAGCAVDVCDLTSMTRPERHTARGPAGTIDRSAKAAATLRQLLRTTSPIPSWVQRVSDSENLRALLAQDIDASATITDKWLHRVKEITRANR